MSWADEAACKGHRPELFFGESRADTDQAKAICADCPVRFECVAEAVRLGDWDTVRGGMPGTRRCKVRSVLVRIVKAGDREGYEHLLGFSIAEMKALRSRECAGPSCSPQAGEATVAA